VAQLFSLGDMRALTFITTFLVSGCLAVAGEPPPKSGLEFALVPQKLVHLSTNEFEKVVLAAERSNNVAAAVDLADYYGYAVNDADRRIKYLEIAAKQGHVVSQYNLGFVYYYDSRVKNLIKAKYWFEIAARAGSEQAKYELHEHEQQFADYNQFSRLGYYCFTIALFLMGSIIAYLQIAKRRREREDVA